MTILVLTVGIGLFGGASRGDVATNAIVQLLGVALILLVWMDAHHAAARPAMRGWIVIVILAAIWMMVQLVPLPPSIWTMLPGRAVYIPEAAVANIDQPWRPISLSPMSTWLSLVGMAVPVGLMLGWGRFDRLELRAGRWILAIIAGTSMLIGLVQISGGIGGGLYLFDNGSPGFPAGLFANRNHQAAALSMVFPLLGTAIVEARIERRGLAPIAAAAGLIACLVLPLLLINGSRAGLALGIVTILLTLVMVATYHVPGQVRSTGRDRLILAGVVVAPLVVAVLASLLGRAAAIERFTRLRIEDDQRYRQLGTVIEMIRVHFPVGAGYGSFARVFRVYEPFTSLKQTYFNHAHNDLIELAFEGGLPSVLLALAAAGLFGRQAWQVWITPDRSRTTLYARAATIMIGALVLASLGDYPLRTPTILVFATIALAWLSAGAALKSNRLPL